MALRPDEFHDHALTAADGERRLPLARRDDLLPEYPAQAAEADAAVVADAPVASVGGRRSATGASQRG
ncbi:hypothetical protein ACIP10_30355 [Streptomyces galbus]|uniref:hypothetical protein n=1 Tax=Streptomyces galbus TaxID=33898 RepID=UPI0037BD43B9